MFLKKNLLWIVLFGSLIGLNETLIGSFNMPYRSAILSTITLSLLSFARIKIPQIGTSMFIILISILFKVNNIGFHFCTTNALLCGPTALFSLGISHEIFASSILLKNPLKYTLQALTCIASALLAFSLFGLMNTFILHSWNTGKLFDYIFIKGSITAIASSLIMIFGIFITWKFENIRIIKFNQLALNSAIGIIIISLWFFGSLTKF